MLKVVLVNCSLANTNQIKKGTIVYCGGIGQEMKTVMSMAVIGDYIYQVKWDLGLFVYKQVNKRFDEQNDRFHLHAARRFLIQSLVPEMLAQQNFLGRYNFITKNMDDQKYSRISIVIVKKYGQGAGWYWMIKFSCKFFALAQYWDELSLSANTLTESDTYQVRDNPRDIIHISGGNDYYAFVLNYNYDPNNIFSDKSMPLILEIAVYRSEINDDKIIGYLCDESSSKNKISWIVKSTSCKVTVKLTNNIAQITYGFTAKSKLYLMSNTHMKVLIMSKSLLNQTEHSVEVRVKKFSDVFDCKKVTDDGPDYVSDDYVDVNVEQEYDKKMVYIFFIYTIIALVLVILCGGYIISFVIIKDVKNSNELIARNCPCCMVKVSMSEMASSRASSYSVRPPPYSFDAERRSSVYPARSNPDNSRKNKEK